MTLKPDKRERVERCEDKSLECIQGLILIVENFTNIRKYIF